MSERIAAADPDGAEYLTLVHFGSRTQSWFGPEKFLFSPLEGEASQNNMNENQEPDRVQHEQAIRALYAGKTNELGHASLR